MFDILEIAFVIAFIYFSGYVHGRIAELMDAKRLTEEIKWDFNYFYEEELFNNPDWWVARHKALYPPDYSVSSNLWYQMVDWDDLKKINREIKAHREERKRKEEEQND